MAPVDREPFIVATTESREIQMTLESQTYAVPLALMSLLVLLGAAALGYLYYRKRRLRLAVEERFKVFRGEAVSLMDRLDGLRRRHETLPSTDPDFTEPMAGATLASTTRLTPISRSSGIGGSRSWSSGIEPRSSSARVRAWHSGTLRRPDG